MLDAHGLSLWDETNGYGPAAYTLGLPDSYDTHARVLLTSGAGETRVVHEEVRTGTVEGSRAPTYLREFEFLAQPASRTLEVQVVNTVNMGKGRFQDKVVGVVEVPPRDLARCPGGQVRPPAACRLFLCPPPRPPCGYPVLRGCCPLSAGSVPVMPGAGGTGCGVYVCMHVCTCDA